MVFQDSKKIRICIAFSKLLKMLKWQFSYFHRIFWQIFACVLCRPSIHTLIFWEMNVLSHVSFIYVWLVISEFSYFKCFCTSRKYQFRLVLGVFLNMIPEMWSNWFKTFTSDAKQSNASDIRQFLFYSKEVVKTGPKIWFSGSFLEVFCFRPLTPDELCPNLLPN